ncbi:uncharacterized protein LOC116828912 isoform X1 [Chelonoidis abingdonii]|uniref:uncharacterized protein LOC116828912 isoform X1 n=1 Tax=Chelonoidis abingdonii TaxID=106734 RepID=UPI003F49727D
MGDSKVKVAVRVRPMNRREFDLHTKCVVDVDTNKVILHPVNTKLAKGDARRITLAQSSCGQPTNEVVSLLLCHFQLMSPQLVAEILFIRLCVHDLALCTLEFYPISITSVFNVNPDLSV